MNWVLGVCGLVTVGFWWFWWRAKGKRNGTPEGSLGWPLIGETIDFIASGYSSNPVNFMQKRKSLYGKVFKSHLLGRPIIVSTDAEVNKAILQNDGRIFVPCYPKSISMLLGESSILKLNGSLQKRVHGLIGSFLKSPCLKAQITKEIELCMEISMQGWKDGHLIFLQEETRNIAFQVLVRVLMSVGPDEEKMQILMKEFRIFVSGLICLPIKLPGTKLYKSLKAKERMHELLKRIIEEKMQKKIRGNGTLMVEKDVVDILLKEMMKEGSDDELSIDFISGNIIEMMIPGEDSVPMLITLAIKYLTDSPLALHHVKEENLELKRRKTHLGENYEWTDYMSLHFTQNVINETLRLANIINAVWRKAHMDVEIKGYLIPKGWCVLASFLSIHMDEENYENPYLFDPWRWQKKEAIGANIFTPFGGGQRLCPGLELARLEVSIFLHHFLTRYRWVAEEDSIVAFPTVKMRRKMPVRVTPIYDP